MKISEEVVKWLREKAYAVKGEDYYFLTDFPPDEIPDNLHIPVKQKLWQQLLDLMGE